MKTLLFAAALLIAPLSNAATNEPARASFRSTSMSCRSVQNAIARSGSAIVHYGDGLYDRYVAHQGYCSHGQTIEARWIPASDTNQCPVWACREIDWD